jgi:hypothetical protein
LRTYNDAPNPLLNLDGTGNVGLPLSYREAKVITEHCVQAPFGQGERTIVDKDVRDTWEMDSQKVRFHNPVWSTFMGKVVQDVCKTLGVNLQASQPRCELYKLLLYEKGSQSVALRNLRREPFCS